MIKLICNTQDELTKAKHALYDSTTGKETWCFEIDEIDIILIEHGNKIDIVKGAFKNDV